MIIKQKFLKLQNLKIELAEFDEMKLNIEKILIDYEDWKFDEIIQQKQLFGNLNHEKNFEI